ncbi:MAG: DUF4956 domain-containing protein [Anaerolineaceae bacterium]|nr:DUF4956 domain-containing protein [Anaerolineaceae bacterium]
MTATLEFILGFALNFLVAWLIVRYIYYPTTYNKSYVFTFLTFNTVIFFVLWFLSGLEIGVGVGFGLFAILTILRYRTDSIPIREMTYLFVIAALPVINSAGVGASAWPELLFANAAALVVIFFIEKEWGFRYETSKVITYEKINLIKPQNYALLLADLKERTGLEIKRAAIGEINFLRDTADIKIYFDEARQGSSNHMEKPAIIYSSSAAMDDD